MNEKNRNGEIVYPPGLYEVPDIETVPVVMQEFGHQVAQRIHDIAEERGAMPSIIGALNGSVLPIYSVLQAWQQTGFDPQDFIDQLHLISTRKIGSEAEAFSLSDTQPEELAVVIEDIVDDGGTGVAIEQLFPQTQFELFAPLSKAGKLDIAKNRLTRTNVVTSRTVNNVWIVGGGGLDGGTLKLNGDHDFQNVELAVAARLMDRYVYHDDSEPLPSYATQLKTFLERRVPCIDPESTLHMWMTQSEWAKMKNGTRMMKDLATTFPYVLAKEFNTPYL